MCQQRELESLADNPGGPAESLHHDISTMIGEAVMLFTLAESPFRKTKKK